MPESYHDYARITGTAAEPAPRWLASDYDAADSSFGVVHENTSNTDWNDAAQLQKGYATETLYKPTSLEVFWPMQTDSGSTAYDFSGNNRDGNRNGPGFSTGITNATQYQFDGTDDKVVLPESSYDTDGESELTMATWVLVEDKDSRNQFVDDRTFFCEFGTASNTYNDGVLVDIHAGGTFDGFGDLTVDNVISSGNWYFLAVTYSSTDDTMRIILDGTEIASKVHDAGGSLTESENFDLQYGLQKGGNAPFDGRGGPFWIWSEQLTESELSTLYDYVLGTSSLITKSKSGTSEAPTEIEFKSVLFSGPFTSNNTVTVYEDTGGDGSGPNTDPNGRAYDISDTITLADQTQTYSLSGFTGDTSNEYWLEFNFNTSDVRHTPLVDTPIELKSP